MDDVLRNVQESSRGPEFFILQVFVGSTGIEMVLLPLNDIEDE